MSRSRVLDITIGDQRKTIDLRDYLDPAQAEEAAGAANAWIKELRHVDVNGKPLRDRFTYRGDSLWWFAELYLHKQGVITEAWETALALDALAAREKPTHVRAADADAVLRHLLPQAADRYGFQWTIDTPAAPARATWRTNLRAHAYTWSALASRLHPRHLLPLLNPRVPHSNERRLVPMRLRRRKGSAARAGGGTVVFAHSAFWRHAPGSADEGEEGYIGKVVRELKTHEAKNGAAARPLRMIGLGPRTNFRARRWWHPLRRQLLDAHDLPLTPIEELASWRALSGSRQMWRDRLAIERALLASAALRDRAHIRDYGIWPILADELRGVARLQFPWSARAMDEAAAALDACRPRLIVTYAEAGGWGRALMLEARRRGIASVGLQHGFIYRHWLNYLHAEDEMAPSPGNRHDRGFPRPDLTLLYDDHAAHHLRTHGNFPEQALRVTGSPALDALAASVAQVTDEDRARVRERLGAAPGRSPRAGRLEVHADRRRDPRARGRRRRAAGRASRHQAASGGNGRPVRPGHGQLTARHHCAAHARPGVAGRLGAAAGHGAFDRGDRRHDARRPHARRAPPQQPDAVRRSRRHGGYLECFRGRGAHGGAGGGPGGPDGRRWVSCGAGGAGHGLSRRPMESGRTGQAAVTGRRGDGRAV